MKVHVSSDAEALGQKAGRAGANLIRAAIEDRGQANIILATGASQFSTLSTLVQENIAWHKVTMFHLDEYIGISVDHPASFKKYLRDRFLAKINFACTHYLIDGMAKPKEEIARISGLIKTHPIDVAFIGIGENGHLAFNDPPADFETEEPYLKVHLDEACRRQQMGEGWFETLDDVPTTAISMSIKQILASQALIVSVPDERKAKAVKNALEGPLTNLSPASILRAHPACQLFLDDASASRLISKVFGN